MEKMEKIFEQEYLSATIKNNFIFSKVMETEHEICRELLEMILKVKIAKISFPEREKVIELRTDSKSVRLDVYVEGNNNRSFDIEMQVSNSDNLSKRMRYYQSLIDGDKLKHGQHYSELGESYIIFICPFDRFKQGRHIYTFREFCVEDKNVELKDGATKIFLSTKGTMNDVSNGVKNFLNYVEDGTIKGKFVKKLDEAVQIVKTNQKVRKEFMTYQMALLESEMKGANKKALEIVKNLLFANTPLKYIVAATGWSEEKILKIKQEIFKDEGKNNDV